MNHAKLMLALLVSAVMFGLAGNAVAHEQHRCVKGFPDRPVLDGHLEQHSIVSSRADLGDVFAHGGALFAASFNVCDGQGRPATTGAGAKRQIGQPSFSRLSGPDANSCAGCHNEPFVGGAGDFVANVFVLAQAADPVVTSTDAQFSNNRNSLGMFGSGPVEMLAREMSVELQTQAAALPDGVHTLQSKGVSFDIVKVGGVVVEAKGIDTDLIVKPFHQAGVVTSLREFSTNAMNHHHGMQAEERFDLNPSKNFDGDFDEDGVYRELTVGDITAVTLWQAQLATPVQVVEGSDAFKRRVALGEKWFDKVGCSGCHTPEMHLTAREFVEPNPFNPPGTCSDTSVCPSVAFDMTTTGQGARLEPTPDGGAVVRAYTDLKRHNLCDPEDRPDAIRHYCNEQLAQGRPDQDGRPGTEFFLTRKLWDVGNSAPYGHRGDLTTIADAIYAHGGEAREVRDRFAGLSAARQLMVVDFLRTLQVQLPDETAGEAD
ncbi:MAG: di-heme oxidoredictase family protein [Pseudomonadota bacterium]